MKYSQNKFEEAIASMIVRQIMALLLSIFGGFLAQKFLGPDIAVGCFMLLVMMWMVAAEWDEESYFELAIKEFGKYWLPILTVPWPLGMMLAL